MAKLNKTKRPIFLYVSLVLFILLLISMQFSSDLYGRYFSTANNADGARVASFEVGDGFKQSYSEQIFVTVQPKQQIRLEFTVQNKSEVAVNYSISAINTTNNLPIKFTVFKVNTSTNELEEFNGQLSPAQTHLLALVVDWSVAPGDPNYDYLTSPEHANKIDLVNLTVTVEQID
ncbi:MAG: hypothetical protein IJW13_01545 [Clostridia bacterium]|nr:hypothetical protein [Clostridia bacterium]